MPYSLNQASSLSLPNTAPTATGSLSSLLGLILQVFGDRNPSSSPQNENTLYQQNPTELSEGIIKLTTDQEQNIGWESAAPTHQDSQRHRTLQQKTEVITPIETISPKRPYTLRFSFTETKPAQKFTNLWQYWSNNNTFSGFLYRSINSPTAYPIEHYNKIPPGLVIQPNGSVSVNLKRDPEAPTGLYLSYKLKLNVTPVLNSQGLNENVSYILEPKTYHLAVGIMLNSYRSKVKQTAQEMLIATGSLIVICIAAKLSSNRKRKVQETLNEITTRVEELVTNENLRQTVSDLAFSLLKSGKIAGYSLPAHSMTDEQLKELIKAAQKMIVELDKQHLLLQVEQQPGVRPSPINDALTEQKYREWKKIQTIITRFIPKPTVPEGAKSSRCLFLGQKVLPPLELATEEIIQNAGTEVNSVIATLSSAQETKPAPATTVTEDKSIPTARNTAGLFADPNEEKTIAAQIHGDQASASAHGYGDEGIASARPQPKPQNPEQQALQDGLHAVLGL